MSTSLSSTSPVLEKLVGARSLARKPDRAGLRLAHLGSVGLREQRASDPVELLGKHPAA